MTGPIEQPDPAAPGLTPATHASPYAWYGLGILFLVYVLNFIDRQIITILAPDIKADLGLSNGQVGLLTGIMFTLLYGILSPFMGLVADARLTVQQLNGLLAEARTSLQKVDAVLVEAQGIASNTREATVDLGALRTEVEASLRKVETLVNEVNRKWPFARDTEIKLP